ncbi:hypothetical protein KCU83_g4899, partial [Aureobasidium melanogenum]
MKLDIAPLPCSGAKMVSQQSRPIRDSTTSNHSDPTRCSSTPDINHRLAADHLLSPAPSHTRLDAATTSKLLYAVTPADNKITGLGITFDNGPSPRVSTMSFNDGSMRNSKNKFHTAKTTTTPVSAHKNSLGAAVAQQNNLNGVPIARTDAPRWPSGVPGLGNSILGPRCPRISNASSSLRIHHHATPEHNNNTIFSVPVTSSNNLPLAPPSRKPSRAIRTDTKRRATSPQSSDRPSAKLAKVSVNSINTQPPNVKREDEQAPKRFGSRRLGPSETEKRAKAAKIWQAEQEKINRQMERTITREGAVSDEIGSYVGKQHSMQNGSQLPHPKTNMIDYACDTTGKSTQLFVEQGDEYEGSHKSHKTSEIVRQGGRSEGSTTKLHHPRPRKELSQDSPYPSTTNTQRSRHALPSAIKAPSSTSSNDKKRVSFIEPPHLTSLTNEFLTLLDPYTHLHPSCPAVRPLQIVHSSLSSGLLTAATLITALNDTQELLKVLSSHQLTTLAKLEDIKEELQRVGMESVVYEARRRVKDTERDVKRLESG